MLLGTGQWVGRGTILTDGATPGQRIQVDVEVAEDRRGLMVSGSVTSQGGQTAGPPRAVETGDAAGRIHWEVSIHVTPDEIGTYTLDAFVGGVRLDGTAKLDSVPNLGLLWREHGRLNATFALFEVGGGCGFRGFARDDRHLHTWEIAFQRKQRVVGGDNVVTLRGRRR